MVTPTAKATELRSARRSWTAPGGRSASGRWGHASRTSSGDNITAARLRTEGQRIERRDGPAGDDRSFSPSCTGTTQRAQGSKCICREYQISGPSAPNPGPPQVPPPWAFDSSPVPLMITHRPCHSLFRSLPGAHDRSAIPAVLALQAVDFQPSRGARSPAKATRSRSPVGIPLHQRAVGASQTIGCQHGRLGHLHWRAPAPCPNHFGITPGLERCLS
jgi:hypothetical protein